jgi:hypothetical protein
VGQVLSETTTTAPCTVLVTPPTTPTSLFGAGRAYSDEAHQIASIIRSEVAKVGSPRVTVADWGAESAQHFAQHKPERDWFSPDGLHPNRPGEIALINLIIESISSCPPSR